MRNSAEVIQGLTPGSSPRRRPSSRKTSVNEPEEDSSLDSVRGMYVATSYPFRVCLLLHGCYVTLTMFLFPRSCVYPVQ